MTFTKASVKDAVKSLIPYRSILLYRVLCNDFKHLRFTIRKTQGNLHPYKVFYVIDFPRTGEGLFWITLCNLSHIAYAIRHGYIPVIDMQNNNNQYLEHDMMHKENSWEYYFEQPAGYSLKDIEESKHVLVTNENVSPMLFERYNFTGMELIERGNIKHIKRLYSKYIRFNSDTQRYLQKEYERILQGKGKILGVLCRGTDYTMKRPAAHPVQPDPSDVIEKARQVMLEKGCSYLYLATEDEEIYTMFRSEFGGRLLTNDQMRFSKEDMQHVRQLFEIQPKRARDKYLRGLEYLTSMYLLSKCDCFIGGLTAGTVGVHLMSKGFDYDYVYELGRYPEPPVK